jgi:hypothetical protein
MSSAKKIALPFFLLLFPVTLFSVQEETSKDPSSQPAARPETPAMGEYNQRVTDQQAQTVFGNSQNTAAAAFSGNAVSDNPAVSKTSNAMNQDRILKELEIQQDLKAGRISPRLAAQRRAELGLASAAGFVSGLVNAASSSASDSNAGSNRKFSAGSSNGDVGNLPLQGSGAVDVNSSNIPEVSVQGLLGDLPPKKWSAG